MVYVFYFDDIVSMLYLFSIFSFIFLCINFVVMYILYIYYPIFINPLVPSSHSPIPQFIWHILSIIYVFLFGVFSNSCVTKTISKWTSAAWVVVTVGLTFGDSHSKPLLQDGHLGAFHMRPFCFSDCIHCHLNKPNAI